MAESKDSFQEKLSDRLRSAAAKRARRVRLPIDGNQFGLVLLMGLVSLTIWGGWMFSRVLAQIAISSTT